MIQINYKLKKLHAQGKVIRIGLVGAGQMGRGMTSQMFLMKGMRPAVIVDSKIELAVNAYTNAGVSEDNIKKVNTLQDANHWLEKGKYLVSENTELASRVNAVDVCIDATGVPEVGAGIAYDAIMNRKHIIMLNVETDVVIGPILKQMADAAGVVYTGSAGDEPGAVMELYDFADALGYEVLAMGKGKNNVVVPGCNPDTVYREATDRGISPRMLSAFKDGTKTMVEMTAMSNATGLIPDVRGGHAADASLSEMTRVLSLKEEGGILNRYGIVDYVNGIAPGVFIILTSESQEIQYQMNYLKMGDGPNFLLYRPYHLCDMETPISAARAYFDNTPTIVPLNGLVSETITIAKRDLKAGEYLDEIGGFTVYGVIETRANAIKEGAFPLGLVTKNTKMRKEVKKGEVVTYDAVEIDNESFVVQLRRMQDKIFE